MSIKALKGQIKNIYNPRRTSYGNVRHKLEDMIVIGLCTLICGGEDYADMEEFGIERERISSSVSGTSRMEYRTVITHFARLFTKG